MTKLITLFTLLFATQLYAQFEENYTPISFKGQIPAEFLTDIQQKTKADISTSDESLAKSSKKEFYNTANISLQSLLLSGDIYFNDDLTKYVRKVASEIVKANPSINSGINVYVSKSSIPNAYALSSGAIVINIGLLCRLENEAQLAFILAHEYAHIEKRHSLIKFERYVGTLKKAKARHVATLAEATSNTEMLENLRHSREHEYEADKAGLLLFANTNYKQTEAAGALEILKKIHLHKYTSSVDFSKIFSTNGVVTPCIESLKGDYADELEKMKEMDGEIWSTHPDLDLRINALKPLSDSGKPFISSEPEFEMIRLICDFEIIARHYKNENYHMSLLRSLQLLNVFPKNRFLKEVVAQSLYWLSFYDSQNSLDKAKPGFLGDDTVNECYCNLRVAKKLKQDVCAYLANLYAETPQSETISIYYARALELNNNIADAKEIYQAHIDKFPQSAHILFAKSRVAK